MVVQTRLLQLAIGVVNFAIVALAFTSIWPFPSGQFKVDLPSSTEVTWTYESGVVHVRAPYSIDNHGFYDVRDLAISYSVTNDSGYALADDDIVIGDVPAGTVTPGVIDFRFDLQRLYDTGAQWMVFNDEVIEFVVEVSCLYTMGLVKFDASYEVLVPWEALIKSYGVSNITYPSTLPAVGDPIAVTVEYWLETSNLLAGVPPAVVTVSYFGDGTRLGTAQTTIQLGANHTGSLQIDVLPELHDSYHVVLEIQVSGFTITEVEEAPSLSGLIP